jgi:hypothetical protein
VDIPVIEFSRLELEGIYIFEFTNLLNCAWLKWRVAPAASEFLRLHQQRESVLVVIAIVSDNGYDQQSKDLKDSKASNEPKCLI